MNNEIKAYQELVEAYKSVISNQEEREENSNELIGAYKVHVSELKETIAISKKLSEAQSNALEHSINLNELLKARLAEVGHPVEEAAIVH